MPISPNDFPPRFFKSGDGLDLAYREVGEGRPVVLIHGLFSNGWTNWIRYGHAAKIAARGFRVIMPDLRAHGSSAAPRDPAAYPPDVLVDDAFALIDHLGLSDYDLGGYSLGGRTVVRMLVRGASPRRAIVSGMGLEGLLDTQARADHFRHVLTGFGTHVRGSPAWMAEAFVKTVGGDPEALIHLLDSFVDTPRGSIATLAMPILVLSGAEDDDNGSSEALAALLPDARFVAVPGGHMSAVTKAEFGTAIADFLAG